MSIHTDPTKKHDFVLLFDVTDGNPNGDPDAGNLPRVDPETMHGLVTDGALKRKVRDFVALHREGEERFKIYVEQGVVLDQQQQRAYTALEEKGVKKEDKVRLGQQWMCENFFDVRLFGAVMSLKNANCGQVRGPVQITFARSADPVVPLTATITRVARSKADGKEEYAQIGRKSFVPYGLYVAHGFFSPHLAAKTGVDEGDLEELWLALTKMFEHDRSATRGMMATRGLYVFTHDSPLGDHPAHDLFDLVEVKSRAAGAPRSFADYEVSVAEPPAPVTLTRVLG